ncbi:MAG: PilZ domain-containing protein [Gammaproteobacteria bacterium]
MRKTGRTRKGRRKKMRGEERIPVSMPISLPNAGGVTRDICASGIFFETEADYLPGNHIEMALEFITPAGKLQLKCQGVIVRVEQHNARLGVAVKISDSNLRYIT